VPGGSLSSWGCGQRRGRPPPETGTTHRATGKAQRLPIPSTPPPNTHTYIPDLTQALDWDDSGSVLKFLGTHRRRRERLCARLPTPAPPLPRRAQATSPEPTPRAALNSKKRGCQRGGAGGWGSPSLGSLPYARWELPAFREVGSRPGPRVSPCPPSLHSALIHRFHTSEPRGNSATLGAAPAPRCGFQLSAPVPARTAASPRPAPGHARAVLGKRALPSPRAASPAFLLPRASPDCDGSERWAPATPHPSVPDDAGGRERLGPVPAGSGTRLCPLERGAWRAPPAAHSPGASWTERTRGTRSGGARGPRPPPCTRPLADHKRKGKRAAPLPLLPAAALDRWGWGWGCLLLTIHALPAAPPPRPAALIHALIYVPLGSAASGNLCPALAGGFTGPLETGEGVGLLYPVGNHKLGEGGVQGGVRTEVNNWPGAVKTKLKTSGAGPGPFPPGLQAAGGRGRNANGHVAPGLELPSS
jgi:hypothetical protein